ncbi:NAD(+) kinase [Pokkaliibacter sp. MBI-7]|uniref:NAD kinase n=1 Tax=Proteobacteria bacterium 228 TaxID=2083153 RepID=A0A2S5KRA3_9PROT|nr:MULTISPECIES: NAD(+) kinase [Pokkaliibacter]MDH2435128.1 NAD(+) kinase [Pokkaliibacter sp. MBI-7]PPC77202.1 NAD(+) kinase [Pokkaliibacter plantistimulans]
MEQFHNVGLIGRLGSPQVIDTVRRLSRFLQQQGLNPILEESIASVMPGHNQQVAGMKIMGEITDLVVVVGGDGSLLGAARALAKHGVPVVGVNRGRLGFLTDISPDEVEEKMMDVLAGRYTSESRFLIGAQVRRKDEVIGEGIGLNDVILHPGKSTRMIAFDLYIDGQFVYHQRSDGLIISTPTGSTAYSLSGGGPIMHPKLDAIVIVPMFPHTLSSRPIVVDGNAELKIVISEKNATYPHISCDGQIHINCAPGDVIRIHKRPHKLRLIHPVNYNFYDTCRNKLGWTADQGG